MLNELKEYIIKRTETSDEWAEYLASCVIGVVAGKNRAIRTYVGKLGLNLFGVYIGPSGFARKTLPLKYIINEIFTKMQEKTKKDLILPSGFSMESMVEYLANKEGKYSSEGLIMKDEFTMLFKEFYHKQYLSDEMEFYSQLYDGWVQKRFTRKTGLDKAVNVYVSLMATTTPLLYNVMTPQTFVQGLGNRIIWMSFQDKQETLPDYNKWSYEWRKEEQDSTELNDIVDTLVKMYETEPDTMYIGYGSTSQMVEDFDQSVKKEGMKLFRENAQDLKYLYLSRQTEKLLKLASIYHFDWSFTKGAEISTIVDSDIRWAREKVEKYYRNYLDMLESWQITGMPEQITTIENYQRAMLKLVFDATEKGESVTRTYLHKRLQWGSKRFQEVIESLTTSGLLKWKMEETGGRKRIIYMPV